MEKTNKLDTLLLIQQELKAPKNQFNKFGNYYYRNCEDILEAVKPLLAKTQAVLNISDKPMQIGDWVFIEATATLTDMDGNSWSASASAKHATEQKGMQDSQITGSTSSYARKYALNGLFAIDDEKDADTQDNTDSGKKTPQNAPQKPTTSVQDKVTALRNETKQNGKVCSECGGDMKLKEGNYGSFYGCSNYPTCKHTEKVDSTVNF